MVVFQNLVSKNKAKKRKFQYDRNETCWNDYKAGWTFQPCSARTRTFGFNSRKHRQKDMNREQHVRIRVYTWYVNANLPPLFTLIVFAQKMFYRFTHWLRFLVFWLSKSANLLKNMERRVQDLCELFLQVPAGSAMPPKLGAVQFICSEASDQRFSQVETV